MKRFFVLFLLITTIFAVHYDITVGTIHVSEVNSLKHEEDDKNKLQFFEYKINRGDTVISIVEGQLQNELPVSINNLIDDFKKLNKDLSPEQIQIGKTYKFPLYNDQQYPN